ncbi:MAG: hypothetical protein AB8H86_09225 [Polyangiales bacterium]
MPGASPPFSLLEVLVDLRNFVSVSRLLIISLALLVGACGYILEVGVWPDDSARVFGGTGSLSVTGSAIDADGNHYIVGRVSGVVDFESFELRGESDETAFLVSFTSAGEPRWSQSWSGPFSFALSVEAMNESVRVTGYVRGPIVGPLPLTTGSRQELFVFEFDQQSGAPLPPAQTYASGAGNVQGKAVLREGSFSALCGHYIGAVDFGLGPLPASPPTQDNGFVAVFDARGDAVWSEAVVGASVLLGDAFLRTDGSVVATGVYTGGTIGGRVAAGQDAIVTAFAPDGRVEYSLGFGSPGGDSASAIAAFEDGAVIVGTTSGDVSIAGETVLGQGARDAFVARLDAAGGVVWARTFGGAGTEILRRVHVENGRIYAGGEFDGEFGFAERTLSAAGGRDVMVLVLDADGNESEGVRLGGAGDESLGGFEVQGGRVWMAITLDGETVLDDAGPQTGALGLRSVQF